MKIFQFADDVVILSCDVDFNVVSSTLQRDFDLYYKNVRQHHSIVNLGKLELQGFISVDVAKNLFLAANDALTKLHIPGQNILFGRTMGTLKVKLEGGKILRWVRSKSVKYLGVVLDQHLTLVPHATRRLRLTYTRFRKLHKIFRVKSTTAADRYLLFSA